MKKLVIFGDTVVAKLAHFFFTRDSDCEVVAFSVDRNYLKVPTCCDLPVLPFEEIEDYHPPGEVSFFVAMGPSNINKSRQEKFQAVKAKGYSLATYVSPNSVCHSPLGENCLVADNAVINPFSKIGDNNFFWEFALVCNDLEIGNHCYFSPGSVISSYTTISDNSVIGTGAIVKARVNVARETLVGARCYITRNTKENGVYGERSSEFLGCISEKVNLSD